MPDKTCTQSPSLAEQLRSAPMATLLMVPFSKQAVDLENRLLKDFVEAEGTQKPRNRGRRATAIQSLKKTISAFFADLVLHSAHESSNGHCYRSFNREAFSETVATYTQFEHLTPIWKALGLIEVAGGFQGTEDFDGEMIRGRGWATRFKATSALLAIAEEFGITPSAIGDHYAAELGRSYPIELRAKKKSQQGRAGKRMKIDKRLTVVQRLASEVQEINQFIADFNYNLPDVPKFRRIFNNGDQPEFTWNHGGRLFAYGADSFQQKNATFRKTITIDLKNTVELDIKSCQLTIAYGLAGKQLPPGDLYEIEGLPRDVVKGLVTAILGKGGLPTRWPVQLAKEYLKAVGRKIGKDHKLSEAINSVVGKHPLLLSLSDLGLNVYRLQHVESQVIVRAMLKLLREAQVPSLPVHDCLIVKAQDENLARSVLVEAFIKEVGISPKITAK